MAGVRSIRKTFLLENLDEKRDRIPPRFSFCCCMLDRKPDLNMSRDPLVLFWGWVLTLSTVTGMASCTKSDFPFYSGSGQRPVYVDLATARMIGNEAPRPVVQGGTIVLKDTLLFQLDYGQGIHISDVSDPTNPVALTFIHIPAITAFALDGSFLFVDNWQDLVTLDITDLLQVVVLSRQENVFEPLMFPPQYSGIFECVDLSKGAVVGWEDADLIDARCQTDQ